MSEERKLADCLGCVVALSGNVVYNHLHTCDQSSRVNAETFPAHEVFKHLIETVEHFLDRHDCDVKSTREAREVLPLAREYVNSLVSIVALQGSVDANGLLPCPFCGSITLDLSDNWDEDSNWVVVCLSCKSSGAFCALKEHAMARWNTRPVTPEAAINRAVWDALKEFRGRLNELQRTEICEDVLVRLVTPEPCKLGQPLMHGPGPQPYRWCKTHNRLMLACELVVPELEAAAALEIRRALEWLAGQKDAEYRRGVEDAVKVADGVSAEYTKDMTHYPEGSGNREISMRQSMAADLVQRKIRALIPVSSTEPEERKQ